MLSMNSLPRTTQLVEDVFLGIRQPLADCLVLEDGDHSHTNEECFDMHVAARDFEVRACQRHHFVLALIRRHCTIGQPMLARFPVPWSTGGGNLKPHPEDNFAKFIAENGSSKTRNKCSVGTEGDGLPVIRANGGKITSQLVHELESQTP